MNKEDKKKVYMVCGGARHLVMDGTMEECQKFCESRNYEYVDRCIVWTLVIE